MELFEVHNQRIFANRQDAGRALAGKLGDLAGRSDVIVLALPRGGVPVAHEVARALGAPLDVFVVRKVGAPRQPELAVGALASGGALVLNDEIVHHLLLSEEQIETMVTKTRVELDDRERLYRGARPPLEVEGRTVIVIDDGIATGASLRVALTAVRALRPSQLVAAAPVAPPEMTTQLRDLADRVEFVDTPADLGAVGAWYDDFRQVSDDEVRRLLAN